MKARLASETQGHSADIAAIKKNAEEENTELRREMLSAAESYAKKIEQLEKMYSGKLNSLKEQKDQELTVSPTAIMLCYILFILHDTSSTLYKDKWLFSPKSVV